MMKKYLITALFAVLFAAPVVTHAALQDDLLAQIDNLLRLVEELQEKLTIIEQEEQKAITDFVSCVAAGNPVMESYPRKCADSGSVFTEILTDALSIVPPSLVCPTLTRNLWFGLRGSDVSKLQEFLRDVGTYTYPEITGYFGPATQRAVEDWQARNDIVNAGTPNTTGFGVVGPLTRKAITHICGGVVEPVACTLQYDPVCGRKGGSVQTYGNTCMLKTQGAEFLYEGQCRDNTTDTAPFMCRIWNDGCNTCSRTEPGGALACTLRACVWEGIAKCEEYFDEEPTGTKPVIHGFAGPTVLKANETGLWEVKASDPQNGRLEYRIDWGENRSSSPFDTIASLAGSGFVQQTTFSHAYAFAGVYTVTITVRDVQGLTATTTTTVNVTGLESPESLTVRPTVGAAPLTVTATIALAPRSGLDLIEICGPIVVGEIDWGDGTIESPTRLGCSSQHIVVVSHTYTAPGTYKIVLERTNGLRFTESVRVSGADTTTFIANPLAGDVPLTVTFTAPGGSSCVDGPDYEIDYGDGTKEMTPSCDGGLKNMFHTYTKKGVYSAVLYKIPSGFRSGDRTPEVAGTQTIIVGDTTPQPWKRTCTSGTNYAAGFYEECSE